MTVPYVFTNNATTTLATAMNTTVTTLNVASGTGSKFPSPTSGQSFAVTLTDAATGLVNEIMYCTSRTGDALTVLRGQEGTAAVSWLINDLVGHLWTAGQAAQLFTTAAYAGFGSGGLAYLAGTQALGTTAYGQVIVIQTPGSPLSAYTVTLPAANVTGALAGTIKTAVINLSNSPVTITKQSGDTLSMDQPILQPYQAAGWVSDNNHNWLTLFSTGGTTHPLVVGNAAASNQALPLGQAQSTFALVNGTGSQQFSAAAGTVSTNVVNYSQFQTSSFGTNGYQEFPGGLILQWGSGTIPTSTALTVTFPIAFPNACLNAQVSTTQLNQFAFIVSISNTQLVIDNTLGSSTLLAYWMAIGY